MYDPILIQSKYKKQNVYISYQQQQGNILNSMNICLVAYTNKIILNFCQQQLHTHTEFH